MTLTWTDSLSLSYAERPRGSPQRDLEPVENRPVFDRGPRLAPSDVGRRSREPLPRTGPKKWAERCAGSLLVLDSCSVVQFDPSGRGPGAMGPADMEGAAAPGGQPLRDVNGAGRDAR